jgi:hypothetical protein
MRAQNSARCWRDGWIGWLFPPGETDGEVAIRTGVIDEVTEPIPQTPRRRGPFGWAARLVECAESVLEGADSLGGLGCKRVGT